MTRESVSVLAARLAAEVLTNGIILTAKVADRLLGSSPVLYRPSFDEVAAERFLAADGLAAMEAGEEVSEPSEHVTYMPAEQFDEVVRTLDEPDDVSGLLSHVALADLPGALPPEFTPDSRQSMWEDEEDAAYGISGQPNDFTSSAPAHSPGQVVAGAPDPTTRVGSLVGSGASLRSENPLYRAIQDEADAAVVADLLEFHRYSPANHSSIGMERHCGCGGRPIDYRDWLQHVSPLIVQALQQ